VKALKSVLDQDLRPVSTLPTDVDLLIEGTGPNAAEFLTEFLLEYKTKAPNRDLPKIFLISDRKVGGPFASGSFLLNTAEEFVGPGQPKPSENWYPSNPVVGPLSVAEIASQTVWNSGRPQKPLAAENGMIRQLADRNLFFPRSDALALAVRWQFYRAGVQYVDSEMIVKTDPVLEAGKDPVINVELKSGKNILARAYYEAVSGRPTTKFRIEAASTQWDLLKFEPKSKTLPRLAQTEQVYAWFKDRNLSEADRYELLKDGKFAVIANGDGPNTILESLIGPTGEAFFKLLDEGRLRIVWMGQSAKTAEEFLEIQNLGRATPSQGVYRQERYQDLARLYQYVGRGFFPMAEKLGTLRVHPAGKMMLYESKVSIEKIHPLSEDDLKFQKNNPDVVITPDADFRVYDSLRAGADHVFYSTGYDYIEAQFRRYLWVKPQYSFSQSYPISIVVPKYSVPGSQADGYPSLVGVLEQANVAPPEARSPKLEPVPYYQTQFRRWTPDHNDPAQYENRSYIGFGTLLKNYGAMVNTVPPAGELARVLVNHYLKTGNWLIYRSEEQQEKHLERMLKRLEREDPTRQ
jgi:hypothetical protein